MAKTLNKEFFKGNRDKLYSSLTSSVLVITANGLLRKSSDENYPFSQDPSFWYLTGINEPDLILVKTKAEEFIIVPKFFIKRQAVIEPLDKESLTAISGISQILDEKTGWQKLDNILKTCQNYASLSPNPVLLKYHGIYSNPARRKLVTKIKRYHPKLKIEDVRKLVSRQRMIKQPLEIALIKQAVNITTDTLKEVLDKNNIKKYNNTAQIEADILNGFKSRGGSGHAFEPVLASGQNSAFIHYSKFQSLKPGDLIVCDVGSTYSFYKADITRTIIYGQQSARQEAVYEAVRYVQAEAYKLIKADMDHKEYEDSVTKLIGDQLIKLGLIKKPDKKSIRQYYMTYCSHSLGLDAHDSADYSVKLPENMVMTVEPGIYIKAEGIGVRLEDVVQITKSGPKILSSNLPTRLNL